MVYKITSGLSLNAPVVFKLFGWHVEENIKYKDFDCFYEKTCEFCGGKVGLKYTFHGRFTEHFLESQTGSGASFTETVFLNAATSSFLKRVTGRILKISKCFQRRK
jgi:hypothetical protein